MTRICSQDRNLQFCTCTYEPCSRKGICCECIRYHWSRGELPGCLFPPEIEKTYDRSLETFIRYYSQNLKTLRKTINNNNPEQKTGDEAAAPD